MRLRKPKAGRGGGYGYPLCVETGEGGMPPSPSAPPPMAIPPRSTARGDAGEEVEPWLALEVTVFHRMSPRTAPAPRGRGRRPKAGWSGGYEYPLCVETGEGGGPPRRPSVFSCSLRSHLAPIGAQVRYARAPRQPHSKTFGLLKLPQVALRTFGARTPLLEA